MLIGGTGADYFILTAAGDSTLGYPDIIADFETGVDKLDLRFIRTSASDSFTIAHANGYAYVTIDLHGDGSPDARVLFAGDPNITAADILLVNPPAAEAVAEASAYLVPG